MRSRRTMAAIVTLSCGLATWATPGRAQVRGDSAVAPPGPGTPARIGILLPATAAQPSDQPTRSLTVDEAVMLALEQNLDLRVERLNPQIQDLSIAEARTVYTPALSTTFQGNSQNSPSSSFLSGGEIKVTDRLASDRVNIAQEVPWAGGRYSVGWDGSRSSTTNVFSAFDPILRSSVNLSYRQPLVRNLKIDGPRQQIAIARTNREMSEIQLEHTVVRTERRVRHAYWELVFTRSFLEVQRQSLALAEESLRNNRTRVEVGTMAPIDIIEAESEVARNGESVIVAEAAVDRAEDQLRTLILDPDDPTFWSIRIQPSDSPELRAREIDVDAAVQRALANRTDLRELDKAIENTETSIRYHRNQQLPDVNLEVDYALSGLGGTRLIRGDGFPGPIVGEERTSFGSVLGDIFSNDFPTWTVGVTVAYPLGATVADAGLERARLERARAQLTRRHLEIQAATAVRDAGRNVTTNLERVAATQVSRQLAERRLTAEQRKFEVGVSTSFFVFQAQRDLASARNNEQRAILDYTKSLVDFDAVQAIPLTEAP